MIKAFNVSILSLFFSPVQIAFINENTEGYLEKAGLLKLTRDIYIKKGTVPGNTGRMGSATFVTATTCFGHPRPKLCSCITVYHLTMV
jgi:hypothetical protein